jgi:hypothetical protein
MSAYTFVGAMDRKKDEYLKFEVDKELHVLTGKAHGGMKFFLPPSDFTGKVITEVVPLSPEDQAALTNGFQTAMAHKKKQKVEYAIKNLETQQDRRFVAAIKHKAKKDSFSVKVKEMRS